MDLHQVFPTIHEGVISKDFPKKSFRRLKHRNVRGTMTKEERAAILSVRNRSVKCYSLTEIEENTELDAEMEKRGIISPYKIESSISSENPLGVREKSLVRAAETTPQNTEGKQNTLLDRGDIILCEGRKSKRNKTKNADLQEKSRGGEKEGTKATAGKGKKKNFEFLASVQEGKLADEECRQKPRRNYQDAQKHCGADRREKENRHKKTTPADRNGKSVNCVEKSPQDALMTKRRTNKVDKSKNPSDARKEDSQRKMKMAEEMEVKALDTWTAVHDKKRKPKEKEKMAERTSCNEEVLGRRKEEAREQNVQKSTEFQSVECNETERRPKKKLQLLDEIMKMDTNVESSDCNKNPKPGRKERNDDTTISEQMFEKKKRSDEKIQRTPTRNGLVTIPREDHLKQINSPPTLNAKTVRSVVSRINHTRGQKSCSQPLNEPVKVPARLVDSPYLSDIRQRGIKVLSTHQPSSITKPVAVFPFKQSKSHCNFPEIYGSKKQAHTDASRPSSSDRIPACSAMRLSPYNKPGFPPATQIHVPPYIPAKATADQVATKNTTRAPTAREMIRIPQSSEKIQNCVQTTNLQAKSKAPVDRTKVLVISQSKRETTVSIKCCIQKKVDDERPLPAKKTNRNANSQNFSPYKTVTSKGSSSSRKLPERRRHGS